MTFNVDARDVELFSGNFYGFFDEKGIEWADSEIMSEEDYAEAKEWSKNF